MIRNSMPRRAQAFDAAGASGYAFLQGQLELIDTDLVRPLQAVTHARDIQVEVGGGFPEFVSAFASQYATTGTQFYGLQGTNNTEIPEAQADIQKGFWRTYIWAMGMTITWVDLKRMEFAMRTRLRRSACKSCTRSQSKPTGPRHWITSCMPASSEILGSSRIRMRRSSWLWPVLPRSPRGLRRLRRKSSQT